MNNKNNKIWWNNNPMTYLDWNLKKSDRLVSQKINFRKLNQQSQSTAWQITQTLSHPQT